MGRMIELSLIKAVDAMHHHRSTVKELATAREIVRELLGSEVVKSEEEGLKMVDKMSQATALVLKKRAAMPLDSEYLVTGCKKNASLNDWFLEFPGGVARDADTFAEEFNNAVVPVMNSVLYNQGFNVHYHLLRTVPEWWDLLIILAELPKVLDLGLLADDRKRAFFFNLANIMIFHSRTKYEAPSSVRSRGEYFSKIKYNVSGHHLNYVDIEHGVLRRKFDNNGRADEELMSFMVKRIDPRMHFALNCGAQSCPIIRPYSTPNLNQELESATTEYIQKFSTVRPKKCEMKIPRLLKWFKADFESVTEDANAETELIVQYVMKYLAKGQKEDALSCLDKGKKLKVKFRKYDWGDNADPDSRKEVGLMYIYDFSFYLSK